MAASPCCATAQVAVPRILDTYRELNIKQTFFIPASCIEKFPDTVKAIVNEGHEVAQHGYMHENPWKLPLRKSLTGCAAASKIIENHTGKDLAATAPRCIILMPTLRKCFDEGFTYDASPQGDDIPCAAHG